MAIPSLTDVLADAASMLGDPSREQFTDAVLLPFFGQAYREMWDLFMRWDLQVANREITYTLPANTTSLTPATAGITDMGEPQLLWERGASGDRYTEMVPCGELPQISPSSLLRYWKWEGDTFYFLGSTAARQLKIEYSMSGVAPTSGSVGVDNSRNFLAARTASKAASVYDRPQAAKDLAFDCFGPSLQPDGTGGYLRALANPMLKEKQKRPHRAQTFRPRRNTVSRNLW